MLQMLTWNILTCLIHALGIVPACSCRTLRSQMLGTVYPYHMQLQDIALARIQAVLNNITASVALVANLTASMDGEPAITQDTFDRTDQAVQWNVSGHAWHHCKAQPPTFPPVVIWRHRQPHIIVKRTLAPCLPCCMLLLEGSLTTQLCRGGTGLRLPLKLL
jgi:hypothetical protein